MQDVQELLNSGIIILDKPMGPTSNQVDHWIKQILGVKKLSHGGTLDPRATGVMVIALSNSTKLMPVLLSVDKEYVAEIFLHKEVSEKNIRETVKEFVGRIKQLPPKHSAVARRVREREIYYLELLDIYNRRILLRVGCEAGTYIRRLADDIGKKLGCGAHLQELRRTRSGIFYEVQTHTLQDISDAKNTGQLQKLILPIEEIAKEIKKVWIKDNAVANIINGAPVAVGGVMRIEDGIELNDFVAVMNGDRFIALGIARMKSEDMANKEKGIAVKTDRVLKIK